MLYFFVFFVFFAAAARLARARSKRMRTLPPGRRRSMPQELRRRRDREARRAGQAALRDCVALGVAAAGIALGTRAPAQGRHARRGRSACALRRETAQHQVHRVLEDLLSGLRRSERGACAASRWIRPFASVQRMFATSHESSRDEHALVARRVRARSARMLQALSQSARHLRDDAAPAARRSRPGSRAPRRSGSTRDAAVQCAM